MQIWAIEKKIESVHRTRNVEIRVSPDRKFFRYYENVWTDVGENELLFYPDGGYWSCSEISGYFASLDDCERDARAHLDWLENS
jgi:hypothetical protein